METTLAHGVLSYKALKLADDLLELRECSDQVQLCVVLVQCSKCRGAGCLR